MKKIKPIVLLWIFFIAAVFIGAAGLSVGRNVGTVYAEGEEENVITLFDKGAGEPLTVLIPQTPSESETQAATVLAGYVQRIVGVQPAVVQSDDVPVEEGKCIVLRQKEIEGAPKGSFILRAGKNADQSPSEDKNLYIEGFDARGVFNGVYAYLRTFCGVNIYSADVVTVPAANKIIVTDGYYLFYKPLLEYADTDWISPHNVDFAVANGLNGVYSPIDGTHGGNVNYILFCHSLSTSIVPASLLFESHPEYFALTEAGKREPTQLCLSNPDVVQRAKEDVLRLIDEKYKDEACLNIISVTQDDNQHYCLCPNCTKIANQYGGQSGLIIWFVNQIADAVAASEHPDTVVDTFAYQYTRSAPKNIEPRKNVCVRLCTIECCFGHALEDPSCMENAAFMSDLKKWSELCSRLYIWDYTTNYAQTIGLFPDFGVIQKNIDTFVKNKVVGIYEEGAYYASQCNTEYADLRAYLLARYMYDPFNTYGTTEGICDGFLKAYYGEGAEEIGQFLDYITEHAGDSDGHLYIYVSMKKTLHGVTASDVEMLDKLWADAEQKAQAAGNEGALYRIRRSKISWDYYKACARKGEFSLLALPSTWIDANKELINSLEEYQVTRYNEGKRMDELEPSPYLTPEQWDRSGADLWVEFAGYILAGIVILLALIVLITVLVKKDYRMLIAAFVGIASIALSWYSSYLFTTWQNVALFWTICLITNFCVAVMAPMIRYVVKRDFPSAKKFLVDWAIGVLVAAIPFVVLLTVFNLVVTTGNKPDFAYSAAFYWHGLLLTIGLLIVFVKQLSKKNYKVPGSQETKKKE